MSTLHRAALGLGTTLIFVSQSVYAHLPVCQCKVEADKVICQGGYSDGSGAFDTPIQVIDYNEKVLLTGKLDENSRFVFDRPQGDFYVFMDGGVVVEQGAPSEMLRNPVQDRTRAFLKKHLHND